MRSYRVVPFCLVLIGLLLHGCSTTPYQVSEPEPWREQRERDCLASGLIADNRFVTARSSLGGPSACSAVRPFEVSAVAGGQVSLRPAATLQCPMIPAVERWVREVVEPAARTHLRMRVVEFKVAASYACRPRNSVFGAKLSEHGHANALDISAFLLADGRTVTVKEGWYGRPEERAFLRAVHGGGCRLFTTVLGPHADSYHRDHFHLDLARHGPRGDIRICK
jgi:hypothetical protein